MVANRFGFFKNNTVFGAIPGTSPTFTLTPDVLVIGRLDNTVNFVIDSSLTNQPTVYWHIVSENITASDIVGNSLTGPVTLDATGEATFAISFILPNSYLTKTFTLELRGFSGEVFATSNTITVKFSSYPPWPIVADEEQIQFELSNNFIATANATLLANSQYGISNTVMSTDGKWLTSTAHVNGNIYVAPTVNVNFLSYNTSSNVMTSIPTGVVSPREYHFSTMGNDGNIYMFPYQPASIANSNSILRFDPITNTATEFGNVFSNYAVVNVINNGAYTLPSGNIVAQLNNLNLGAPNHKPWFKYDPVANTVNGYNVYTHSNTFYGDVLRSSVCLSTTNNEHVYVILANASSSRLATIEAENGNEITSIVVANNSDEWWSKLITGADNKVYGIPNLANEILIYTPSNANVTYSNFSLNFSTVASPLQFARKYSSATLGSDGKIYCAPSTANAFLVIDTQPSSNTYGTAYFTNFGLGLGDGNQGTPTSQLKFADITQAEDKILVVPNRYTSFVTIDVNGTGNANALISPYINTTSTSF